LTTAPVLSPADPKLPKLRRLSELGRAFTYAVSLQDVAQLTVDGATELVDAASSVLMLQDPEGLLQVRASSGVAEDRVRRFRAPLDDEVIGRLQGLLASEGDRLLAVPLVVGGVVTGLLAAAKPVDDATESDEWLLSALADQAAVGLENARLGGEVRVEMETRLRASEGATNAKDRALATLAHDIRTPLGAIEGYCTVIEEGLYGPVTDAQVQALSRVRMSGRHLLSLLDNVMDMARLTAGAGGVKSEPVSLREIARESVDMLTPASIAKSIDLRFVADLDVAVLADGARLRQVFVNLVGNAVKFTPNGGTVTVTVGEHCVGGTQWGELRVTDTGPGIVEAERASIFEPYFRSEAAAALPGIGLGLAISNGLVGQMHGSLAVESVAGAGSSFFVRLPSTVHPAGA
jgi:sigma-B regulation protein RsbU (phosphoserine phosphatase)